MNRLEAQSRRAGDGWSPALEGLPWPIYATAAVLLAAYIALLAARPTGEHSTLIDGWSVDAFELLAGVLCILGGRRRRSGSAVPRLLGAAVISWALGDTAVTVYTLGGAAAPVPSVADAFYLGFFVLSYVAVVLLIRGEAGALTVPSWLDGAVAGLGAAAVCAAFAFCTIVRTTDESPLATAVNLAYPIGDVLLLLLIAGGTAVISGRRRAPWLLISTGFAVNIVGDTANLFAPSLAGTHLGTIANATAWPISSTLLSAAMWISPGARDPLATRRPPGFLLPTLAAVAGLSILFTSTLRSVNHVATALATATLVVVVLRTWLSVRELRAETRERHLLSVTDHLTGLPNRRRLFEALEALFAQAPEARPRLALLFVDLDGFKRINDSFGHPVGDQLLVRVGGRLQGALRPGDLLARIGGDEFAALLVGAGAREAGSIARRLCASLGEPFRLEAVSAGIGASVGIALARGAASDQLDGDVLLARADAAMYRAKLAATGFAFYESELDRAAGRLALADDLSAAIASGQLVLHYQPQLNLHDGRVTAAEALIRWRHPEHGLVPASQLLPLAEEAGLMGRLTRWVLGEALAQCAVWRAGDGAGRDLTVSVNVGAGDLLDESLPATIAALIAGASLPPGVLTIEITETSIVSELERAQRVVAALRGLGVHVSIDDFGAGFTSLAYLNDLAVDELKLDRRFIAPLAGGKGSRESELVRATIELGHALGLRVVAEGIEDDGALKLVRELGCDLAQGYGVGVPRPAHELDLVAMGPAHRHRASGRDGDSRRGALDYAAPAGSLR